MNKRQQKEVPALSVIHYYYPVFKFCRRAFSPGARQRPLRPDGFRERKHPVASPAKRPRMETHPYQEPERRPMAKPAYKVAAEPKMSNNPVVIEKKPVIFNPAASKSVSEFPPLPQRKPVQRQPPKSGPQKPEPVMTAPQSQELVKTVPQKQDPLKNVAQKQEPLKNVPQKQEPLKNVPQKQEPLKNVPQKQEPVKNSPLKQEAGTKKQEINKTVQKQTIVQQQEVKPAPKKQPTIDQKLEPKTITENKDVKPAEAKESEPAPSVEPAPVGSHQLTPAMSRALNDELQQIMTKVSQELPKEPNTEADRLVVGKFKTIAGEDFKNALGLNVTKRILDIHNPLYVKLLFSGKPEAGCLQAFIGKYKISAFKRIDSPHDTFAARLDAVADFDRLCQAKEVACGSAKVTVTPCYKFLSCPTAIKTIYASKANVTKEIPEPSSNSTPQKQEVTEKTENSGAKTATMDNIVRAKDDSKEEVNKTAVSQNTDVSDKTGETTTVTPVKNTKTIAANHVKVNITIEAKSKTNDVKKEEVTKSETKTESLKESIKNSGTNTKVTNQNNIVDNTNKEAKNKSMDEEETVGDEHIDDEEMTDQDILALMSGGIVLDECSGSDDEN